MDKIAVVSFKSPPYSEVGAYRWAKFLRYLANNYIIHLVTVNWVSSFYQPWHDDIKHKNIVIHRISSLYPHNLKYHKYSKSFSGKILDKIRNQIIKFLSFFYYIDEAQFWGFTLIPCLKRLIKNEDIKLIIATGAPFMANYWVSFFKEKINKDIILIHDFRDEWNEYRNFLFKWQKKQSIKKELFTLYNCDALVTVSNGLKELFMKKNNKLFVEIIPNGYDSSIEQNLIFNEKIRRDFSFIYAGSLSNERDKVLFEFLSIVNECKKKYPEIKIKLFISYNDQKKIKRLFRELISEKILVIKDLIPQDHLFREIYNSFVALHVMPECQRFIISIKLFEYAFLKRPVFSLNAGGDTDELIKEYKLGYSVDYRNRKEIYSALLELYNIWKDNPSYEIDFDEKLKDYSYKNLAKKYESLINNLLKRKE